MSHEIHPEERRSIAPEPGRQLAAKGEEMVDEQRARAISSVAALARALDVAAESLSADRHPMLADTATRAAREIEDLGASLKHQDPRAFLVELRRFAHRSPTAFIGGAAALGFGLARFFESYDEVHGETPATGVTGEDAPSGRKGAL